MTVEKKVGNLTHDEFQTMSKDAWEASSAEYKLSDWLKLSEETRRDKLEACNYGKKKNWFQRMFS